MKAFDVTMLDKGKTSTRKVFADTVEDARLNCISEGLIVVNVRPSRTSPTRRRKFPLSLFIQELIALLDAGLVTVEAIEALHESAKETHQKEILKNILKSLYQGNQLSASFSSQSAYFPSLLVSMVASAEGSGQLSAALTRFNHYEKRMEKLKKRIKGTLIYPSVVISVGGLCIFFLLGFIIPRFATVFSEMTNPGLTAKVIVWWGALVDNHASLLLSGSGIIFISAIMALRNQSLRKKMINILFLIPFIKEKYKLAVLVRFYRTLGLLLQGGMPAIESLHITHSLLPADYHENFRNVIKNVDSGNSISSSLEEYNFTTPVASRLLRAGEQSGKLADMCERIAAFYDETLDRAIDNFSKVFEPVLMLLVGGMVGLVVFLLYMPIFEMAGGLQP